MNCPKGKWRQCGCGVNKFPKNMISLGFLMFVDKPHRCPTRMPIWLSHLRNTNVTTQYSEILMKTQTRNIPWKGR